MMHAYESSEIQKSNPNQTHLVSDNSSNPLASVSINEWGIPRITQLNILKKASGKNLRSARYKPSPVPKKTTVGLRELQSLQDKIGKITTNFFLSYPDQLKVDQFRSQFYNWFNGGYLDVILTIRHFKDFNLFDYINISTHYAPNLTEKQKEDKKQAVCVRNNIFLGVLVEAAQAQLIEKKGERRSLTGSQIFSDLTFLLPHLETFKSLILEKENAIEIEYDVEFFFLSILGFRDKAEMIKQKFNGYFKQFLSECNVKMTIDQFLIDAFDKKSFDEYTEDEIIILRKILNNTANRNFSNGIEFLSRNLDYCYLISEGRIWKSFALNLNPKIFYSIWTRYEAFQELICERDLRPTIEIEHRQRLKDIRESILQIQGESQLEVEERNRLKFVQMEMEKDISLNFIRCLRELVILLFKSDKKDLVLYMLDEYKNTRKRMKISVEIFEICLDYDEEISIEAMDRAINNDNVQAFYMQIALLKKYFKLARNLLKYKVCKNYLNLPPPESEDYMFLMHKHHLKQKKEMFEKMELEKHLKPTQNDKFMELLKHENSNKNIEESFSREHDMIIDYDAVVEASLNPSKTFNTGIISNKRIEGILSSDQKEVLKEKIKKSITALSSHYSTGSFNKIFLVRNATGKYPSTQSLGNIQHSGAASILLSKDNKLEEKAEKTAHVVFSEACSPKTRMKLKPSQEEQRSLDIVSRFLDREQTLMPKDSNNRDKSLSQTNNSNLMASQICSKSKFSSKMKSSERLSIVPVNFQKKYTQNKSGNKSGVGVSRNNSMFESRDTKGRTATVQDEIRIDTIRTGKSKINVQLVLIDQLRYGNYTYYALCLLNAINEKYLNTDYADKICQNLLVYTRDEEAMTRCRHPLLVCSMGAEFLRKLGRVNPKVHYKCKSVSDLFLNLGGKIQAAMKDEDMLNYYLKLQTDHIGRSALEINAENRFYDSLSDENVGSIVGKLWYGSGNEQSMFKFNRISRIFSCNIFHEHYEHVASSTFLPENSVYSFQYCQYTKNCSVRYLVDSVSTILTTILYQFIIYAFVSLMKENKDRNADKMFNRMNNAANVIVYTIILNFLLYLLYIYKTSRSLKVNMIFYLDVVMFFAVLANFLNFQNYIADVETDSNYLIDAVIYSIIIICAWMRVIGILLTTYAFGPFLRIMYKIMFQVIAFLLIMFALNTVFAQVLTILFKKTNDNFNTFFYSWVTLFNAAFGIYNMDGFKEMKVFGFSLLMAYITISNIMFLNLIIAIINNLYHQNQEKADAENRAVLVLTYERIKWDEKYGLFILLPAPFNILSLVFILILLIIQNDETKIKANALFSKICYIVVAFGNCLIMILASMAIFPFAVMKSLVHSAYDNISQFTYGRIPIYIWVIITRPFVLFWYFCQDFVRFWRIVYKQPRERGHDREKPMITKEVMSAIRKVLSDYKHKEKKKIITLDELYSKLGLERKKKNMKKMNTKHVKIVDNIVSPAHSTAVPTAESILHSDAKESNGCITPRAKLSCLSSSSCGQNIPNPTDTNPRDSLTQPPLIPEDLIKDSFRYVIDKIVDSERIIDIDRSLLVLPYRVKYTDHFIDNLHYINMRVFLRGLKKYFFLNAVNNPIYSFKKVQQMVYKLLIKFQMVYNFLPREERENMKGKFEMINTDPHYIKNYEAFRKYEDNDQISDYDDEGEICGVDGRSSSSLNLKSVYNTMMSSQDNTGGSSK